MKIAWDANDEWLLFHQDGERSSALLLGDSYIHPKLTVLRFKVEGRFWAKSVVLLTDNVDLQAFRHLRVRLKLTRQDDESDAFN